MNVKFPFALLLSALLISPVLAADFYVDPVSGSDGSGDGSSGNPWQTLTHTFGQSLGSDPTVHLAAGTFTSELEGIDFNAGGTQWVVIPGSLGNVTIVGSGSTTTLFDPSVASTVPNGYSSVPTWKQFYIFTTDGLASLTLQDVGMTNGRALLLAQNIGDVTVENVIISSPDVETYGNLPPVHVHNSTGDVTLNNLMVSDTRSDVDDSEGYGGGVTLVHDVSGNVTITNLIADGASSPWYDGGSVCIDDISGGITLDQLQISNSTSGNEGGSIYIGTVNGAVSISNVTLSNSYSTWGSGGGICIEDAQSTIDLNTVGIDGGRADQDGGALFITNVRDDVITDGLNITGSEAVYASGGAVSIKNLLAAGIHIQMLNGIFDGNLTDQSDGGAVAVNGYNADSDTLTIDNFLVKNNSSGNWGEGGGIWVKDVSVVYFTNSTIKGNSNASVGSGYSGGGAYIENVESMTVDNVAFIENSSAGNGGGFAVYNQSNVNNDITVHQVLFLDNTTVGDKWTGDGGGFYVDDAGDVTVEYALFAGNYASGDGGAMYFDRFNNNSSLDMSSVTMAYNESEQDGDAFFNSQNVDIEIENTIVWANGDTDRTVDPATLSSTDAIDGNLNQLDVSYSDIQTDGNLTGVTDDTTNNNIDPFFSDPTVNDFTVLPGSPMLDSGDPTYPDSLLEEPEPNNDIINVGYTPPATMVVEGDDTTYVAAPVGSPVEPVDAGDNTAASVAKTRAVRNLYMMIGAPVVPKDSLQSDPFGAWGDNLNDTKPSDGSYTWRFSRWMNIPDSSFYGYVRYDELLDDDGREIGDPPPITPGYGYWFIYGDQVTTYDSLSIDIMPEGMAASGDSSYVLPLDPKPADSTGVPYGYNMMANPWPFEIDWQDVRFGTSETGPWVDPTTAASNGWVDAHAITWNNLGQTYVPKTGTLKAWEGFWVVVKVESPQLYIQFNPSSSTAGKRSGDMSPKFMAALEQNLSWSTLISVRAVDRHLGDMNTWIGLGPALEDTFDTFDALDPGPVTYETIYNRTKLVKNGSLTSTSLSRDFRKDDLSSSGFKAWMISPIYYRSASNPEGGTAQNMDVRFQMPTISSVPDSIKLSLYDVTPGQWAFDPNSTPNLLIDDLAETPDSVITLDWTNFGDEYRFRYLWVVATLREPAPGKLSDLADSGTLPDRTQLTSTYPNPFNSATSIKFQLAHPSTIHLVVYDVLGRRVATIADGLWTPGYHTLSWDATGHASGIYFLRFDAGETGVHQMRKILYQK